MLPGAVVTLRPPTKTVGGLICAQPLSALDNPSREPVKRLTLAFSPDRHFHDRSATHLIEATVDLAGGGIVQPDPHLRSTPIEDETLTCWEDLTGFLSLVRGEYKLTLNGLAPDPTVLLPFTRKLALETLDQMPYGMLHDKDKRIHLGAHAGMHGADGLPTISLIRQLPNNKTEAGTWAQLLRVADKRNPLARVFGPNGMITSASAVEAKTLEGTAQWALNHLDLIRSVPL